MADIAALTQYFWMIPAVVFGSVAIGVWARARARERHAPLGNRLGRTAMSTVAQPLPGDLSLIATLGENAAPRMTANMIEMRTTPGLRLISLGLSGLFLALLWTGGFAVTGFLPTQGVIPWLISAGVVIGMVEVFTYELRVDRSVMVLTRFMFWRRVYMWDDLMGIDDDQNYQYVLAFAKGGRVKVLKHLVGMPGFLTFVAEVLERNDARNAGTARG
jgi:hypothetical protein